MAKSPTGSIAHAGKMTEVLGSPLRVEGTTLSAVLALRQATGQSWGGDSVLGEGDERRH